MKYIIHLLILLLVTSCNTAHTPEIYGPEPNLTQDFDWPYYSQNMASTKYAGLDEINRDNVKDLEVSWTWNSVDNDEVKLRPQFVPLTFKSTPIKIGNKLYINTSLGSVVALDAMTGEQLWRFDTKPWADGRPANMGFNTRGVSYWADDDKSRIIVGTNNAYLWSLDAETGLPDKTFGVEGRVDLTKGLGREVKRGMYSSVAPPMIVNNMVIMGAVVFDLPVIGYLTELQSDLPPGHIRGFDVSTGEQKWIFRSIPLPGEPGNETWEQDSWKVTGATNVWTMMSCDEELGYLYLPFSTPTNDFYGGHRVTFALG